MDWIGVTARTVLPICLALLLWAVPQDAWAGACKEAGLRSGCAKKGDIARDSLRGVDIKVESQGFFGLGNDAFDIPAKFKPYAELTLTLPAKGWLIITASANISAGSANDVEGKADIGCVFNVGRRFSTSKPIARSGFTASASRKFQPLTSISWSYVQLLLPQEAGKRRKVFLACRLRGGSKLNIFQPAITVVFHPIRYRSKR